MDKRKNNPCDDKENINFSFPKPFTFKIKVEEDDALATDAHGLTPPKETWKTSDATNIPIKETVHNNEILIHSLNKEALRVKVELPELHSTDPQIKKLSEYQYTNDIGKLSEGENLTFVFEIEKEKINQNDNLQSVANTGEIKEKKRDFKCHVCGKCLSRKDSLKNHILLMHPELKRFVCQTCGRSYVLKADFEKQMKTFPKEKSN